ncbi:hypothetical protein [Streptomyces sp. NPDC055912]|uniref:hypothetical protein n=1 Tax=Streptomyces sp. NPDC055912 TaxID=3345660 RepID=UPI0035DCDF55
MIFAILAAAATAATALVIKVGRRVAKGHRAGRTARGAGGAGPGGTLRRGGSAGGRAARGGGSLGQGNRSGSTGHTPRRTGSGKSSPTPGALSRKPAGMGSVKAPSSRTGSGSKNASTRTPGKGLTGARSGAAKPYKGSLFGGRPGSGSAGAQGGGGKHRKPPTPGAQTSRRGLLNRRTPGSGTGIGATAPTSPKQNRNGPSQVGGKGRGGTGTAPKSSVGGKGRTKIIPFPRRGKGSGKGPGKAGSGGGKGKAPVRKGPGKKKTGKAKAPRHRRYTWKRPHRKLAAAVGRGYKKVTSKKFRRGVRRAGTPFRAVYRGTKKHGGKLLANTMRWGGRAMLSIHSVLGSVRYSSAGPNWFRPLSKVMYWATSPLAKLVTVSRTWTWLNSWVYRTATARPTPKPVAATAPAAGTGTPAAPPSGGHTPVPSPAAATAPKGTPVDNSPVQHTYPLIYAADAIRTAGQAFAAAPADSMKGYEAVIEHLGQVNYAMFELMHRVATVTQDDFKVDPNIPDQFRVIGRHFLALGQFIDSAHGLYRQIHAAQLENIENPTWQGRKWDVSVNWAHIMPTYAWANPLVHAMPLLFASAAVRDAGAHIQMHPAGSMAGYEMTIEHLAPLAEELYVLMETVAAVTESEFSVSPAVTEMHRDAAQRFRDLGGAIQGVHLMYRVVHAEQLHNLENPTYQGAKWDQSRNA